MTTAADVLGYRQFETRLNRAYLGDLKSVTEKIAGNSALQQRDLLLRAFPELVLPHLTAMQDFAASWAEDLHAEQSVKVRAPRLELPNDDAFEATVKWAIAPAFGEVAGTVFGNLAGAGQRYIGDAGREVIVGMQPARPGASTLTRFPEPGACDWCLETAGSTPGSHDNCHCVIAPTFDGDAF